MSAPPGGLDPRLAGNGDGDPLMRCLAANDGLSAEAGHDVPTSLMRQQPSGCGPMHQCCAECLARILLTPAVRKPDGTLL
jgi:hypothetical protein